MTRRRAPPAGALGLRWTYLRPCGTGDRYSLDLYRPNGGSDSVEPVEAAKGVPEYAVGEYELNLDRKELDDWIAELVWLWER